MPQPLSRVKKLKEWRGGPDAILAEPGLAFGVMRVISIWSYTEAALGRVLASLLHADSSSGLAMYLSLSGATARKAALDAAAETSLTGEDLNLYHQVMRAIKPIRERRNDFAHGLWSVSTDLPGALIWDKPENHLKDFEANLKAKAAPPDSRLVYRIADIQSDLDNAFQATKLANLLGWIFDPNQSHIHDEARTTLLASPLLQKSGASRYR